MVVPFSLIAGLCSHKERLSLHSRTKSFVAHQLAGGDPDFSSIKLLEVFLLSHGWEASPSQGDFPMQCRGLGLDSNPGPLNQASSALAIRPPSVSPIYISCFYFTICGTF